MMKIVSLFLALSFSLNYCFASDCHKETDLNTIEKNVSEKFKIQNSVYPKDSTEKPPKILKENKKKTDAHKLGLMSFGAVFLSYILITASFFTFPIYVRPFIRGLSQLGLLAGLSGFFAAILSLFKYRKEKNKNGRGFPIASILMVLLPFLTFLVLIFQLIFVQQR